MGEVYRGLDTRLDRTVAIKVLNSSLARTPDLKARFEREARVVSQLQHANICVLHDVGSEDGTDFLVMEFLEGETLADRLRRGPLSLDQALRIGIEIAEALDKAHRAGIVHRDLKPGNVMLTKAGAKLLDFGLAKPLAAAGAPAAPGGGGSAPASASVFSAALTMTSPAPSPASPLSTAGAVLGTVQYMSPEQIQGTEADARSDIFAFGLMLFEMATGKRAFEGKTQASVVGQILAVDPPPASSVKADVPPAMDRVIRLCLKKDPDERYQSVHDLKLQLQAIAEAATQSAPVVEAAQSRGVSHWAWIATAAALLLAVGVAAYFAYIALQPKPAVHAYILPPDKAQFSTIPGSGAGAPAISPDGTKLAFIARPQGGKPMLYVQALSSATAQPLVGTEDAAHPFWSPDGRWIGFFAGNLVKKIEAAGGPPQTLCEAPPNERGGSWGADGTILFGFGSSVSPLMRVSSAGGTSLPALKFEPGETAHRWPQWLPDGKHFLFFSDNSKPDLTGVYVGSLDSPEHKLILRNVTHAQYVASGYLLFLREQTLMAQAINLRRLELTGEAVPVAEHVAASLGIRRALFSASDNGVLVYQTGAGLSSGWNLVWYDRQGKQVGTVGGVESYFSPAISPDGTRVATVMGPGTSTEADVWIFDLRRGTSTRLTFGPGRMRSPRWTPDGKSILYSAMRNGKWAILRKAADNSGPEEIVLSSEANNVVTSVSHDGRYLIFERQEISSKPTGPDLLVLPLFGDHKPFPIVQTPFTDIQGAISPDGKWLAYASNQSGIFEIYVTAFPGGGTKSQVSVSGGYAPTWRNDGRELYYETGDIRLMAVDVSFSGGAIQLGAAKQILQSSMVSSSFGPYAVLDGKKFLVNAVGGSSDGNPFTLVTNWPGLLKK